MYIFSVSCTPPRVVIHAWHPFLMLLLRRCTFLWGIASHSYSRKGPTSAKVLSRRRRGRRLLSSSSHRCSMVLVIHLGSWLANPSVWCYDAGETPYVTALARCGLALSSWKTAAFPIFASVGAWPLIHNKPYHSGVLCLIQLKMEPNYSSLIHRSIDIHLVAILQTYTEIYLHLYNVSELFWPSLHSHDVANCWVDLDRGTLKRSCVNKISEDCDDLEVNNWLFFKYRYVAWPMNIHNGLPPKNNTESLSYIGGYFENYITDILHISVRMTLISTYIFGIYVSYLLDNCALIRNKVCTQKWDWCLY